MVRGDLILVDLGHGTGTGTGTEPGKTRPAVIVQSDILSQAGHRSTIVLVCTSKLIGETLLRVCLPAKSAGNKLETEVLVDQIRAVDNRRILRKLGTVPKAIFEEVEEKLRLVLSLDR